MKNARICRGRKFHFLLKMRVGNYPFLHLYAEPERVDAERYDGEQKPYYVLAEKLRARPVEKALTPV